MTISVNILTWNSIGITLEAIHILKHDLKKADLAHEIIVVDNGSTDMTTEILYNMQATYPNLKIITNKENIGISRGKNQAIDVSKGDYIFMLDGDIIPVPNSIICFYEFMEKMPNIDILGARWNRFSQQRNANGQCFHEEYCERVVNLLKERRAPIYYGMFRRYMFDMGLRIDETPPFDSVGYGFEDHDFWELCQAHGIDSWFVEINKPGRRYYHTINSSLKLIGRTEYRELYVKRHDYFKAKWKDCGVWDIWKPGDYRDELKGTLVWDHNELREIF